MKPNTARSAAESEVESTSGRTLTIRGGLGYFLTRRRNGSGTYRSGEARFQRINQVTQSEIVFQNGMGRATRAAHLSMGQAGRSSHFFSIAGELLLGN